jgi:hypothetical protein
MPWIIDQVKHSLDRLSPTLFAKRRIPATKSIHDEVEKLAQLYANSIGVTFGPYPDVPIGAPDRNLLVFRDGSPVFPSHTERRFLHDQSWMLFYNNATSRVLGRTDTPLVGYLHRCEMVMEVEWDFAQRVPEHKANEFHRDFQKLVIAKAPFKIFVFQSRTSDECRLTVAELQTQLCCFESGGSTETYLLSGWCNGMFSHNEFTP